MHVLIGGILPPFTLGECPMKKQAPKRYTRNLHVPAMYTYAKKKSGPHGKPYKATRNQEKSNLRSNEK